MITTHKKRMESSLNIFEYDKSEDFSNMLKDRNFKMNEMLVSWKYVIIINIGQQKFFQTD